jgi:O-antigen biosynthesis protein
MELVALRPIYRGREWMIQPGQVFEESYTPRAEQLIRQGVAAMRQYETAVVNRESGRGMVTCIMPTRNRRKYIPGAIDCWQAQTYDRRELIVLDNGDDQVSDLMPNDPRIRYMRLAAKQTLGQLRNFACQLGAGEFIAHWDDDDWYHPKRLEEQLAAIGDMQVVGYRTILFEWPDGTVRRYQGERNYATGTSLLYRRTWWEAHRFRPKQVGEDGDFVAEAKAVIVLMDGTGRCVARNHDSNTSPRHLKNITKSKNWTEATREDLPPEYLTQG